MKEDELKPYQGRHVVLHTVDGHRVKGYLQGVGYAGTTIMRSGLRYTGPRLADIQSVTAKGAEPEPVPGKVTVDYEYSYRFAAKAYDEAAEKLEALASLHTQEEYLINTIINTIIIPPTKHFGCFTCKSDGPCRTAKIIEGGKQDG